jgi:chorismate mutase
LKELRDTIDLVDQNILLLIAERQALVEKVGDVKRKRGRGVADPRREREILASQLTFARLLGLDESFTREMFRAVFRMARGVQRRARVAP